MLKIEMKNKNVLTSNNTSICNKSLRHFLEASVCWIFVGFFYICIYYVYVYICVYVCVMYVHKVILCYVLFSCSDRFLERKDHEKLINESKDLLFGACELAQSRCSKVIIMRSKVSRDKRSHGWIYALYTMFFKSDLLVLSKGWCRKYIVFFQTPKF